jgi:hypothetical protein
MNAEALFIGGCTMMGLAVLMSALGATDYTPPYMAGFVMLMFMANAARLGNK